MQLLLWLIMLSLWCSVTRCCHRGFCRGTRLNETAVSVYMWLSVCRCAAAAVSLVAPCQAAAADPLEMVASSQGSPVISPPSLVPAHLVDSKKHREPEGNIAVSTPASGVRRTSCWVFNVSLELRIYFYKKLNEWKRICFKKLNKFCWFCRFAPFCSELCLQTLTAGLPRTLFWHAVVMKRRARRTTRGSSRL